ncbi:MAG: hypothetical protein A2Z71_11315 [Chloroflexi bacterium RBG_13_50_21]|nr:MAG: hypothetical protein A2Z71_11315 [Chloroflexi bacterium RBG_13_50_21]
MRRRLIIGGAVLIAAGTSAVKMSKSEAQQVEQHTGQMPEDLTEEQLDAAMEELGIEGQEPTDQEMNMLEAEDQNAQPTSAYSPPSEDDMIARLERLGTLKAQGLLTEEEYTQAKQKLLAS